MFSFQCPNSILERLREYTKKSPSIPEKIASLTENPIARANKTNMPAIGDYYMNVGNLYAILFNVDIENETIIVLSIVSRSLLYRLFVAERHLN